MQIIILEPGDANFTYWCRRLYDDNLHCGPGWLFYRIFGDPEYHSLISYMAIMLNKKERPIGVAVAWRYQYTAVEHVGCFIVDKHRRKGYGTRVIGAIGGTYKRHYSTGKEGSDLFWLKQKEIDHGS